MRTDGWTDGETDMTKFIVAFRNFVKAPKTDTPLLVMRTTINFEAFLLYFWGNDVWKSAMYIFYIYIFIYLFIHAHTQAYVCVHVYMYVRVCTSLTHSGMYLVCTCYVSTHTHTRIYISSLYVCMCSKLMFFTCMHVFCVCVFWHDLCKSSPNTHL